MNQAEEDALIAKVYDKKDAHLSLDESIRLAIRAAVAQVRERAAGEFALQAQSKESVEARFYRYLRDEAESDGDGPMVSHGYGDDFDFVAGEELDAIMRQAVDRAAAQEARQASEDQVERLLLDSEAAHAHITALTDDRKRLQQALFFWLPSIASEETPAGERAAKDSRLLISPDLKDEPSAYELGWIVMDSDIKWLRDDLKESEAELERARDLGNKYYLDAVDAKERLAKAEAERDELKRHAEAQDHQIECLLASEIGRKWNWPGTGHETAMKNLREVHDAYRAAHPKEEA